MIRGLKLGTIVPLALFVGCGVSNIDAPQYDPNSNGLSAENLEGEDPNGNDVPQDLTVLPPSEYYEQLLVDSFRKIEDPSFQFNNDASATLWLNFGRATINKGFQKSESFLLCSSSARFDGGDLSTSDIEEIISMVADTLSKSDIDLNVVTKKPFSGDYTTAIIGGSYDGLGCSDDKKISAIGPQDIGNANPNDIFLIFTDIDTDNEKIANLIVKKAVDAMGGTQSSTSLQTTPPTYQPIAGLPNLDDELSNTPGLNQIAAMGQLLPDIQDASDVDVTALLNQLNGVVPQGTALPGFDRIISIIAVANGASSQQSGGGNNGAVDLSALMDILDPNNLNGGLGALLNLAGLGDITQALTIISGLFGSAAGNNNNQPAQIPPISKVPDFGTLLSLVPAATPANLFDNLLKTGTVINSNFAGADRDALLSMIKVAYSQAIQQTAP